MDKIYIVFWTQTGNTEEMAKAIGEGVELAGKEPVLVSPSEVELSEIIEQPAFAMGCPAMGCEELEESEMEPFVAKIESFVRGKNVALFGSYGWGDGLWMREWESRMKLAGATIVGNEGIIVQDNPSDNDIAKCRELGKMLARI